MKNCVGFKNSNTSQNSQTPVSQYTHARAKHLKRGWAR